MGSPEELKAKTGGQALSVRPTDPADLPTVVSVMSAITGVGAEVAQSTATVPVTDATVLPAVVRGLDDAGVPVAELALRGASLDEVFLSLTGHRAEDGDTDGPAAATAAGSAGTAARSAGTAGDGDAPANLERTSA
jgi:oleandomycin transport system ATP-binding protein